MINYTEVCLNILKRDAEYKTEVAVHAYKFIIFFL